MLPDPNCPTFRDGLGAHEPFAVLLWNSNEGIALAGKFGGHRSHRYPHGYRALGGLIEGARGTLQKGNQVGLSSSLNPTKPSRIAFGADDFRRGVENIAGASSNVCRFLFARPWYENSGLGVLVSKPLNVAPRPSAKNVLRSQFAESTAENATLVQISSAVTLAYTAVKKSPFF